ncbi:HdeA/HdeB family chaperone [Rhizobium sp. RAF56]|uniref:HdeA/HdeB family chaperone n=1 Tax=Rhizobium sp. RAF56 TaxID=3233062 RepID=UPI003F964D3E
MIRVISIALAVAGLGLAGQVFAAEMDMSKLTCKEVGNMPPAKIIGIAMWVNGYVHGKAGSAMIDGDKAHANAEKVAAYCKSNASSTLANALEAVAKK